MSLTTQKRVAVIGGVHGDELTGYYVVEQLKKNQFFSLSNFNHLDISLHVGNPKAVALRRRYVDSDLNRCFSKENLDCAMDSSAHEDQRAYILNQSLGPKGGAKVDCIIDMHTAVSNMGITIIPTNISDDNLLVLSEFIKLVPDAKILLGFSDDRLEQPYLASISASGYAIEIGPLAMGVLSYEKIDMMQKSLYALLTVINGNADSGRCSLEVYRMYQVVHFPKEPCGIIALVHPQVECYKKISKGDPLFIKFDGDMIHYASDVEAYPVFINEQAYLKDNIAMILAKKVTIKSSKKN